MICKCPVCGLPLLEKGKSLYCTNKHTFDISKNGYINLLLTTQKKSKNPGDGKEMLLCRRNFLNSGYYQPLLSEIIQLINTFSEGKGVNNFNLLDLGCGEGYYICKIKEFFNENCFNNNYYGLDISKYAISLASKRHCTINFIVGNAFSLPFFDDSFDIIISIFSHFKPEEINRILKPGSIFILVEPGKNHLFSLIKMIYDNPLHHKKKVNSIDKNNFELIRKKVINYNLILPNKEDINNLFTMTPYFWQATPEKQKSIMELSGLEVEIDFNIEVYKKNPY